MNVSIIVLAVVFLLIAVRRIGRFHFGLWQAMLLGAVAVLIAGEIGPWQALQTIDPDVMLFLGWLWSARPWRRAVARFSFLTECRA